MVVSKQRLRGRLLTGERPTGILHLGHYVGSVRDRLKLQDDYECFFIIADLHCLTTQYKKTQILEIPENVKNLILDYLAVGINPEKSHIYLQSAITELYKMNLICEMLIGVSQLQAIQNIKEMAKAAGMKDVSFGLLGYPVLQAADILSLRANVIPIGPDEHPQIEIAQEIARTFNKTYKKIFPIPKIITSEKKILVGLDGKRKMSKSLKNAIYISDDPETVRRKVARSPIFSKYPEKSPVFIYNDYFNQNLEEKKLLKKFYREGRLNENQIKKEVSKVINQFLEPFRERRAYYEKRPKLIKEILISGTKRVQREVKETMELVEDVMGFKEIKKLIEK
jgi:tryptophanyl-tRNA synthetase